MIELNYFLKSWVENRCRIDTKIRAPRGRGRAEGRFRQLGGGGGGFKSTSERSLLQITTSRIIFHRAWLLAWFFENVWSTVYIFWLEFDRAQSKGQYGICNNWTKHNISKEEHQEGWHDLCFLRICMFYRTLQRFIRVEKPARRTDARFMLHLDLPDQQLPQLPKREEEHSYETRWLYGS